MYRQIGEESRMKQVKWIKLWGSLYITKIQNDDGSYSVFRVFIDKCVCAYNAGYWPAMDRRWLLHRPRWRSDEESTSFRQKRIALVILTSATDLASEARRRRCPRSASSLLRLHPHPWRRRSRRSGTYPPPVSSSTVCLFDLTLTLNINIHDNDDDDDEDDDIRFSIPLFLSRHRDVSVVQSSSLRDLRFSLCIRSRGKE